MFTPLLLFATLFHPKKAPTTEEESLIDGLRRGETAAYEALLREYRPMLLGYAWRMLGDRDEAEEVVQESFVSIYQNIQRFEGRCSLRSWLFRIAHHKAIDHLRRASRFVTADDRDPMEDRFAASGAWAEPPGAWDRSLEKRAEARQMLSLVQDAMQRLPHHYCEILTLREIYQMDTEEICHAMGISAVNVRVLLHRARQALYQIVEARLQDSPPPDL